VFRRQADAISARVDAFWLNSTSQAVLQHLRASVHRQAKIHAPAYGTRTGRYPDRIGANWREQFQIGRDRPVPIHGD
jgi:hypothetical protein